MLKHLLPHIPKHTCYCEPFGGGLAVFLAKPRSPHEVINDLNGDLISFYRCVRFHTHTLLTELEFVMNSRQEFVDFRAQPGLTDIQRAARWFHRNKTCFGGNMDSFRVAADCAVSSRENRMELIRQLSLRLDKTTIEHLSWEKCLALYDRPATFFFLDPPYTDCGAPTYGVWQVSDVIALREQLAALKGRWLLTLNDSAAIRSIFRDFVVTPIERARGVNNKPGQSASYRELVIRPRARP